ncbi:helix-turn-helix domain-containing protein [Streptomyces spectabilis]|uniref:Helix-turn-helix transcriptional regulator n=1 Tax=Streptomyces spectabilis TaxID=68270 RepID=A0A516RI86_STRST|nr:helix-turn-helix domain-containing protein [Streptomyces spectabilis]QDQ15355.1 helix-turn-helix transcriptional regulator [Streptomyces spectabilis]
MAGRPSSTPCTPPRAGSTRCSAWTSRSSRSCTWRAAGCCSSRPSSAATAPPPSSTPASNPSSSTPSSTAPARRSLAALLGRARALLLEAAADGTFTTTELARHTGLTPSNASRHLVALREAALVSSRRHRNTTLHTVTALGVSLLDGGRPSLPA